MPLKILTQRSTIVSARLLRDTLEPLLHRRIILTTDSTRIRGPFIRYGNAEPVRVPDTEFNSAAFIELVAHKGRFAKVMAAEQVHSPVYHRTTRPARYPVLIRKTLTGMGGSGIVICIDEAAFNRHWDPAYVWTPFVPTEFELRVHVLGGGVAKILKKVYRPDQARDADLDEGAESDRDEPDHPIRNMDAGYHFAARTIAAYPKVVELVNRLHPLLNGAFYSLDIGWDRAKRAYLVFEANSGSGLNPRTAELYAHYLNQHI